MCVYVDLGICGIQSSVIKQLTFLVCNFDL